MSSCQPRQLSRGPLDEGFAVLVRILVGRQRPVHHDNDEQETLALDGPPHQRGRADQVVHFREHVRVIAPLLRSNLESWEAGTSAHACILHQSSRRAI